MTQPTPSSAVPERASVGESAARHVERLIAAALPRLDASPPMIGSRILGAARTGDWDTAADLLSDVLGSSSNLNAPEGQQVSHAVASVLARYRRLAQWREEAMSFLHASGASDDSLMLLDDVMRDPDPMRLDALADSLEDSPPPGAKPSQARAIALKARQFAEDLRNVRPS